MIYETLNLTEAARPLRRNSPHFLLNTSSFLREWTTTVSIPPMFQTFFSARLCNFRMTMAFVSNSYVSRRASVPKHSVRRVGQQY